MWWMAISVASVAQAGVTDDVSMRTLDNGLRVVAVPLSSPGLVAVQTWMDVGSGDEVQPGRSGYAHFFEHLMFHGSKALPGDQREARLLELGVAENAWTSNDATCYHLLMPTDSLPDVLAIEADRFTSLYLDDARLRREAGAVLGEFRKSRAIPWVALSEALYATAFTVHPYAHSTLGYRADVEGMPEGLDAARAFFDTWYRPDRAVLVVAGDVDPDEVFALVQQTHGGWRVRSDAPLPVVPAEPAQDAPRTVEVDWDRGGTSGLVAMAWKVPAWDPISVAAAALDVTRELLVSRTAPLHRRLVEDGALAWDVSADPGHSAAPGLFELDVELRDGVEAATVERAVLEELAALREAPDLDERVEAIRARMHRETLVGLDSPEDWGFEIGSLALRTGDAHALDARQDALAQVDATAVRAVLDGVFRAQGRTIAELHVAGGDR